MTRAIYIDKFTIVSINSNQHLALITRSIYTIINKGNNKITELRTILERESQNKRFYLHSGVCSKPGVGFLMLYVVVFLCPVS